MTKDDETTTPAPTGRMAGWFTGRRAVLAGAVLLLVLGTVAAAVWALRTPYGVLFARLSESDASAAVERLKSTKTPFRLAEGGTTILVPSDRIYETRLALLADGMPVSGGVGFEIFDKQSFGMSEAAQRVAYQRALQGELARTIGAIDHVRSVRVHLVLPEAGLFKRDREPARAGVSLTLDDRAVPNRNEIRGIQRLVAASVQGLEATQVVITDQHGVALTPDPVGGGLGGDERLQLKQAAEQYVTRKVLAMLDDALGPGQAIVSVDATLDFDEVKRTIQDVLPARDAGGHATGWLTRRRSSISSTPSLASTMTDAEDDPSRVDAGTESQESDYQYGSRLEQVVAAPGGVSRLAVAVIVRPDVAADELVRLRDLVRAASGVNDARGDTVVLQSLGSVRGAASVTQVPAMVPGQGSSVGPQRVGAPVPGAMAAPVRSAWLIGLAVLIGLLVVVAVFRPRPPARLTDEERTRVLSEIRSAMAAAKGPLA